MKGVAPRSLSPLYIGRYMNAWEFRTRNCARICLAALIEYCDIQMRPFHVGLVEMAYDACLENKSGETPPRVRILHPTQDSCVVKALIQSLPLWAVKN